VCCAYTQAANFYGRPWHANYFEKVLSGGKLGVCRKFLDLSRENPFGFGLKQNKLTDGLGFSDWRHLAYHLSRHEISMEHMQNCKKWSELKTWLGKNCTTDKFSSEGPPNICGTQAATKPGTALNIPPYTV
jgi:hypothetical protein